jgi:hypothetical protein
MTALGARSKRRHWPWPDHLTQEEAAELERLRVLVNANAAERRTLSLAIYAIRHRATMRAQREGKRT